MNLYLQALLYLVAIALIIVLIVLSIKMIFIIDRADNVLKNVEDDMKQIDAIFDKTIEWAEKMKSTPKRIKTLIIDKKNLIKNKLHRKKD